jgi:predicted permease
MFGGAVCLLLIACTNLANLLLARALARAQEIAVRVAIGAGRARIARQLLVESLLLGAAGGAVGLLLAAIATPLLARLVPIALPVGATPAIDWRVFAFAAALTLATCVAFGAAPAYQSYRAPDLNALRSRSRAGRRTGVMRGALVVAEVAGTVVLLVAAGLLVKALWRVQAVDPGFRADGVLTLRTALPSPKYSGPPARASFYSRVLGAARALPGVTSAAYVSYQPMEPASGKMPVLVPGVFDDPLQAPSAIIHFITPGFFETLRVPIVHGRDFDDRDDEISPLVAVISQSLADRLWPAQDPLGRKLFAARAERTVVGVARSIRVRGIETAGDPQIYFPAAQLGTMSTYYAPKDLLVRVDGDPLVLAPSLTKIVHDADAAQAVADVRLLSDIVGAQTAPRRDQAAALGAFALLAFLLAAVGIHGLLSFTVSARAQEIGVRLALGAPRGRILAMFLRQGCVLGVVGIAAAVPLAYAAARGMSALLFGVNPADPAIYASAVLVAAVMTVVGSFSPAFRASSIDPNTTMRMAE